MAVHICCSHLDIAQYQIRKIIIYISEELAISLFRIYIENAAASFFMETVNYLNMMVIFSSFLHVVEIRTLY